MCIEMVQKGTFWAKCPIKGTNPYFEKSGYAPDGKCTAVEICTLCTETIHRYNYSASMRDCQYKTHFPLLNSLGLHHIAFKLMQLCTKKWDCRT